MSYRCLRMVIRWMVLVVSLCGYAHADSARCRSAVDPQVSQYIVGYGSLMQEKSKREDSTNVSENIPIDVVGFERGWMVHSDDLRFGTTYLGVRVKPNAILNAVYFKLNEPQDIRHYDERETMYCRVLVPREKIRPLTATALPEGQFWIYITSSEEAPTSQFPIVQSYVDIFLSGCFELQNKYHLSGFAKECVTTTVRWSSDWVNDRIHPRTAHENIPYSPQIDSLTQALLPQYASQVKIE